VLTLPQLPKLNVGALYMKFFITKPCPSTFVSRGFQECTVWFGAKPVRKGITIYDDEGSLLEKSLWRFSQWEESEDSLGYCSAKIFFKGQGDTPLFNDFWRKLVSTYKPDYDTVTGEGDNFFSAVNQLYNEAIPEGAFNKIDFYPELDEVFGRVKTDDQEEVEGFLRIASMDKLTSDNTECEGMSHHEWVVEYDIDVKLCSNTSDNNAWLTKNHTKNGFDLWLGKGYPPVYRHAMIIDPCFKDILSDKSRRPSEFSGDSKTTKFNITSQQPVLHSLLSDIAAPVYTCHLNELSERYSSAKNAFYEEHLAAAKEVVTDVDFFAFYSSPGFADYRAVDLAGEEFDYFDNGDFTPNHLALMLLDVMSDDVARKSVDAEGSGFENWVVPISVEWDCSC
jgi:hypothetical protein